MVLRHLCASRYLDSIIENNYWHFPRLRAWEDNEMGEDKVRRVFLNMETR